MRYHAYCKKLSQEVNIRNYSSRTEKSYVRCVEYFLCYRVKTENNITTKDRDLIKKLILHLQAQNKAPKTINLYKSAIMFFCNEVLSL
jgi:hypothetical protein